MVELEGFEPNPTSVAVSMRYKRVFYLCNELVTSV